MIQYTTSKGIVKVELDKNNRPVFQVPPGMFGDVWLSERDNLLKQLKKDFPHVKLCKKKPNA